MFSPHPSKDPRENLRVLQSPLKNSFKSPVKASLHEEDQIILVEGNHPRVVQEERDLVILEDVALAPPSPSKPHANIEPPQTPPRRKSLGGNALHRAVLIRSAQRAVLKAEKEREEEEEEMEVLGVVSADGDQFDNERENIEDTEMTSPAEEDECDYLDEAEQPEGNDQKPMWRKSLEKIVWPFGSSEVYIFPIKLIGYYLNTQSRRIHRTQMRRMMVAVFLKMIKMLVVLRRLDP